MEMIEKIWLTDDAVWIRTADGREACEKFADDPRLIGAEYLIYIYGIFARKFCIFRKFALSLQDTILRL